MSTWEIERDRTNVVCPECAFSFDAIHQDGDGGYTCPLCEPAPASGEPSGAAPLLPTHGKHGGPLVQIVAEYEDGTRTTVSPGACAALTLSEGCAPAASGSGAEAVVREALRLRFTCPLCGTENEPTQGEVVMGERYQCSECETALVFSVASPELDAMHDDVFAPAGQREAGEDTADLRVSGYVRNWMQRDARFRIIGIDIEKRETPWRMTVRCIRDDAQEATPDPCPECGAKAFRYSYGPRWKYDHAESCSLHGSGGFFWRPGKECAWTPFDGGGWHSACGRNVLLLPVDSLCTCGRSICPDTSGEGAGE